jgi:predicted dinucleotide-binding enzyme
VFQWVGEDSGDRDGQDGARFASSLAPHHDVALGSRDPARAAATVRNSGTSGVKTYQDAAAYAEVVILAVPWEALEATVAQTGDLRKKVVVDVSFPYKKIDRERLLKTSSTGEELQ